MRGKLGQVAVLLIILLLIIIIYYIVIVHQIITLVNGEFSQLIEQISEIISSRYNK